MIPRLLLLFGRLWHTPWLLGSLGIKFFVACLWWQFPSACFFVPLLLHLWWLLTLVFVLLNLWLSSNDGGFGRIRLAPFASFGLWWLFLLLLTMLNRLRRTPFFGLWVIALSLEAVGSRFIWQRLLLHLGTVIRLPTLDCWCRIRNSTTLWHTTVPTCNNTFGNSLFLLLCC